VHSILCSVKHNENVKIKKYSHRKRGIPFGHKCFLIRRFSLFAVTIRFFSLRKVSFKIEIQVRTRFFFLIFYFIPAFFGPVKNIFKMIIDILFGPQKPASHFTLDNFIFQRCKKTFSKWQSTYQFGLKILQVILF